MLRKSPSLLATILGLALLPAAAHADEVYEHPGKKVWEPYAIEKTCADGRYHCRIRMVYATSQNSMVARSGSYWYRKPFQTGAGEDARRGGEPGQYGY